MTKTKWLRRALLGSVALGVMTTGAGATELDALKAELEALQSRVNELESQPAATTAAPQGTSYLTFERGMGSNSDANWGVNRRNDSAVPDDRGYTIAITPTADMPAPVAEITVYGYVKGDVIYDFDCDLGTSFSLTVLNAGGPYAKGGCSQTQYDEVIIGEDDQVEAVLLRGGWDEDHLRMHAKQSRFGIRSKVDTAVGQVRSRIEGDFFGAAGNDFRLRHAYGEWDMTPNWTLLVGQTDYTANITNTGIETVDFYYSAGPWGTSRRPQVRLTYHDGPVSWAVAAERPWFESETSMPDVSAYFKYDAAGGHSFMITGSVADWEPAFDETPDYKNDDLGWVVLAGASINLADVATLSLAAGYGEGLVVGYMNQDEGDIPEVTCSFNDPDNCSPTEAWGVSVGLSFAVSETTSFNVQWGLTDNLESAYGCFYDTLGYICDLNYVQTVHANVLWQPVKQLKLGWEVMWGQKVFGEDRNRVGYDYDTKERDAEAVRAQFGAWFYF